MTLGGIDHIGLTVAVASILISLATIYFQVRQSIIHDVVSYQTDRLEHLLEQAAGDVPLASAAKEQEA